jgi:glycosyltransferase involved in cell wall biosynthesis
VRVLHVTPFYEPFWAYGGMARASSALCRALARRGHEVTVATASLGPGPPAQEVLGGVQVRRFPSPAVLNRWLVPWSPRLGSFLERELSAFDLAHLHGHRSGLALTAGRVFRAAGRPYVLQPGGTFPHHDQHRLAKAVLDRAVAGRVSGGAAAWVAVSDSEARDLPRPAAVVPNGVEACGRVSEGPRRPGPPRLLFVGTDRPQKRGRALIELLRALPEAHLRLVGRFGPAFASAFDRFPGRVTVGGVLEGDALAEAYADADLVVHPAVGEAFGLVPFEAALVGTPSVVAGGHGCGEWFARAGGAVVPPDEPLALEAAVRARLRDAERGRAEAQAVAAFARAQLTWDRAAEAVEAVYRGVAAAR